MASFQNILIYKCGQRWKFFSEMNLLVQFINIFGDMLTNFADFFPFVSSSQRKSIDQSLTFWILKFQGSQRIGYEMLQKLKKVYKITKNTIRGTYSSPELCRQDKKDTKKEIWCKSSFKGGVSRDFLYPVFSLISSSWSHKDVLGPFWFFLLFHGVIGFLKWLPGAWDTGEFQT